MYKIMTEVQREKLRNSISEMGGASALAELANVNGAIKLTAESKQNCQDDIQEFKEDNYKVFEDLEALEARKHSAQQGLDRLCEERSVIESAIIGRLDKTIEAKKP